MAEFNNADVVLSIPRKFTKMELARALRQSIADEYEAIHVYTQIAEATDDAYIEAVIMDIVWEEQLHASQFWELLAEVDPSEHQAWEAAVKENAEHKAKAKR
ncbi:MAG TPA: ferritin family protein [Methanomassiliicoccales archaeon]|jgi:rubrerythrin|nr:ferritin family protein [Methanomassiliicoccales archaeon]